MMRVYDPIYIFFIKNKVKYHLLSVKGKAFQKVQSWYLRGFLQVSTNM